ncbi:MAG: Do family serine endopeptidase [Verrucomicrobiota bacterium]
MKIQVYLTLIVVSAFQLLHGDDAPELRVDVDDKQIHSGKNGPLVSYADVLDKATPSVVAVYTAQIITDRRPSGRQQLPDFWRRQFGLPESDSSEEDEAPRERRQELGAGSGVVISPEGYIITNHHVVQGMRGRQADEIRVQLSDGREYEAELVGSDQKTDVAVLKIEAEEVLPALTLADSDKLRVGDVVFAIGNPLDIGMTATQGIVSAVGRDQGGRVLGPGSYENFIQTDAAINFGNSGGALIDAWGRLIGINTAIVSGTGGSIGIGFAIPVNMALNVTENLVESGAVPRGMLGLFPGNLNRDLADAFGRESMKGALVNQVQEDSPAQQAGIEHGDIITFIDEIEIESAQQLRLVVSQMLPGSKVMVTLIRQGKTMEIPVTLGSLDGNPVDAEPDLIKGVLLREIDEEIREEFSIPDEIEGLFVAVVEGDSPFFEKLERLNVILEVNGEKVDQPEDVENLLKEGINRLYIWFEGSKRFVVIKL